MEKHLKSEQHYINLHDEFTIEKCRRIERDYQEEMEDLKKKKGKLSEDKMKAIYMAYYFIWRHEAGERYLRKKQEIEEWMERDKKRDVYYANAEAPTDIYCIDCSSEMKVEIKSLDIAINDEDERVMFIFRCGDKKCGKARVFYDDGEERIREPDLCKECSSEYEVKHNRSGDTVTTKYFCPNCKNQELDKYTFKSTKKKKDKYFERDRKRFCFDEKEGGKYVEEKESIIRFSELAEKLEKDKNNREVIEQAKLKKITIVQMEDSLISILEKNLYKKLELSTPEIGRDVRVDFTVRDAPPKRDEYQSRALLKKLIDKALIETNWRLMSMGISYKLGILSGSLRGYENEEDLVKLANKLKK